MHAIRILRSHGMDDAQLQLVYCSVVIAKLTYGSSSWGGGSPLHRTGNALKVFFVAVVDKICTQLTNPQ